MLWVELPQSIDSMQLYRQALERQISIVPGPIFSTGQNYQHCIRLHCGYPWCHDTEAAIAILGQLARQRV
jgi:DNA-binding transcriptional MocR family regulator